MDFRRGVVDCDDLKACRSGWVWVWKLRNVICDDFGSCLTALAIQRGRFRMKAIVGELFM